MLNIIAALAQRARQERDALAAGRLGTGDDPSAGTGFNVGNIPVASGAARIPLALLHAIGLAQEGASNYGKMATGTMGAGLAALQQAQQSPLGGAVNALAQTVPVVGGIANALQLGEHLGPLNPMEAGPLKSADAQRALGAFLAQPGIGGELAANEQLAHTNKYAAGAANQIGNPLNYAGQLVKAPGLLGQVGRVGEVVNNAPFVPFRALRAYQVGDEVMPLVKALLTGAEPPPSSATPLLAQAMAKVRALRGTPLETADSAGPLLPAVLGPAKQGRRLVPETQLPETPYTPGDVPRKALLPGIGKNGGKGLGPLAPPVPEPALPDTLMREPSFANGPASVLQELAQRLGVTPRTGQPVGDLLAAARGIETPPPGLPTPTVALNAPTAAIEDATAAATNLADRLGTIKQVANAPIAHLNSVLADLHNAIYPGQSADFAIPALTGQPRSAFRTSFLTDHPQGNAAEPYLDYLLNRVQKDPKAAARLADLNPQLADDVANLAPNAMKTEEHKRLIQSLFKGVGETPTSGATPLTDAQAAFDGILASGDSGKMGRELPTGTAFWEKRLGVSPEDAQSLLDGAVADGRLGQLPDGALAIKPRRATGGDVAAGGGMGLLPYPGGLNGVAGRAVLPLAGAAGGAAIGALTGDNPDDVMGNAAKGAAIGGALGAGAEFSPEIAQQVANLSQGTMYSPTMLKRMWDAGVAGQTEAAASKGVEGTGNLLKAAPGAWRAQMVNTLKQFPQDALSRLVTLWGIARKELGVTGTDIREWQEIVADERATGVSSLNNPVTDKLRRLGQQRLLNPDEFHKVYGTDFVTSEASRAGTKLNAKQSAGMGAAFAAANGLRTLNPFSVVAGGVKGRFQPFINAFVQFGNGVQHDAFRYAMADKTLERDIPPLAKALTDDLAARGVDVTPLLAKGGYFSGDDVAKVAGAKLGKQWDTLVEETVRNGGDRIAFLAGDFREASKFKFEDTAGKVFPFIRWPLHYGPVLAEVAANNPRLATVAAGLLAQQQAAAKAGGLKAYEALSTPITTETPGLGGLARLRLGGQSGTVRLNLPGSVLPYSQLLGGVDMPSGDNVTGYEKAKAALGAVGMTPTPAIGAATYVLGQDYQAPGALSRTAGLEALPRLLPGEAGRATVPGVGTLLDTARQALAPVTGAHTSDYDPTYRRYAELVLETTKKPLDDVANQHYLLQDTAQAQALYTQAVHDVVLSGAAGNLYSLNSPISATARGADAEAANTAKAGVPFDKARIDASTSGTLQELMQAANARYAQQHPEVGTYGVSNPTDAKYTILRQWEASPNANWLKVNEPSAYNRAKKSLSELLGLTAATP